MKAIIFSLLLIITATSGAKELHIELTYPADENRKTIPTQLLKKFTTLLEKDAKLKAEFEKIQAAAQERGGGRYGLGEPQILVIPRLETAEFRASGVRTFHDTVIIYYPFVEGFRGGMMVTDGTFAVFQLKGKIDYKAAEGDQFEVTTALVKAKFDGFQKSIQAKQKAPSE